MNRWWDVSALLVVLVIAACDGGGRSSLGPDLGGQDVVAAVETTAADSTAPPDTAPDAPPTVYPAPPDFMGGERPATYRVPAGYTHDASWPLVLQLHGYTGSSFIIDVLLRFSEQVDDMGFLLVTPDGLKDGDGMQFWGATDMCCNFDDVPVDDVAYLLGLVDEMSKYFHVDPRRVYVVGHSNGGFMGYRLACEAGDRIAAIVNLGGALWLDPARCPADHPVGILHVHGTADTTIYYDGYTGPIDEDHEYSGYPSAMDSVTFWTQRNGCDDPTEGMPIDVAPDLAGAETIPKEWSGCEDGRRVVLWTMVDSPHTPNLTDGAFARLAMEFLLTQARPD